MRDCEQRNREKYVILLFAVGALFLDASINIDILATSFIGQNSLDTLFSYALLCFILLQYWLQNGFVIRKKSVLLTLIIVASFALDVFRANQIPIVRNNIINLFLTRCLIGLFCSMIPLSIEQFKKSFKIIGFTMFFTSFLLPFMPSSVLALYDDASYGAYMLFGQHMTVAVIIMLYFSFQENKPVYKLLSILGGVEVLILGNRGSVICILFFIVLYYILYIRNLRFILLIGVITLLYCTVTSSTGMAIIIKFLSKFNIESRNLMKLVEGTLGVSGREHIYDYYINLINENKLFGVGISYSWSKGYPHQFFYEIWTQYGVVFGSILPLIFFVNCFKICTNRVDPEIGKIYLVFFTIGFLPLLFSGSYWTSSWFWVMIGVGFTMNRMIKENRREGRIDYKADFKIE